MHVYIYIYSWSWSCLYFENFPCNLHFCIINFQTILKHLIVTDNISQSTTGWLNIQKFTFPSINNFASGKTLQIKMLKENHLLTELIHQYSGRIPLCALLAWMILEISCHTAGISSTLHTVTGFIQTETHKVSHLWLCILQIT